MRRLGVIKLGGNVDSVRKIDLLHLLLINFTEPKKVIQMDDLEYKQMREREQAVVDRLNIDTGKVKPIDLLKDSAFQALRTAEKRMHAYACELEVGDERTKAFEIFENIRNAARVG